MGRHAVLTALCTAAVLVAQIFAVPSAAAQSQPTPQAAPTCSAASHRGLDFWLGEWEVRWTAQDGQTGVGSNVVSTGYGGCVIQERYQDSTTAFAGTSLLGFDRRAGQWKQTWWDNRGASYRSHGGRQGDRFVLDLEPVAATGPAFRIVFEEIQPDSLVWRFQTGAGDGEWRDLTVSRYRRVGPPSAN